MSSRGLSSPMLVMFLRRYLKNYLFLCNYFKRICLDWVAKAFEFNSLLAEQGVCVPVHQQKMERGEVLASVPGQGGRAPAIAASANLALEEETYFMVLRLQDQRSFPTDHLHCLFRAVKQNKY